MANDEAIHSVRHSPFAIRHSPFIRTLNHDHHNPKPGRSAGRGDPGSARIDPGCPRAVDRDDLYRGRPTGRPGCDPTGQTRPFRSGPHHRPPGDQPTVGLPHHDPALHRRAVADDFRGQCAFRPIGRPAPGHDPPLAEGTFRHHRSALVAGRLSARRRLPGHGLGDRSHAAAHGHLLPALHVAGRFGLSAPGGLQPGQHVQKERRPRQTGHEHDDGLWLQRGRGGGHPHHRQPARTADRHHHQQLLPVQWPLAHPDPDRHPLRGGLGPARPGRVDLRHRGGGHRPAGRLSHLCRLLGALPHRAEGARSPPSAWNCPPIARRGSGRPSTPRSSTGPCLCYGGPSSLPPRPAR